MAILGMPLDMFLVFAATIIAGSLGAVHYVIVHVIMGKPVDEYIRGKAATEGGTRDGR